MRNILAAIDFSERSEAVLRTALEQAKAFGAHLWLVHVAAPEPGFVGYDAGPQSVRDNVAKHIRERHREIQVMAEAVRAQGVEVTSLLIRGSTVKALLGEAEKLSVDLIVLGSHGHGLMHRVLLGSVSQAILQKSLVPVLLIPHGIPSVPAAPQSAPAAPAAPAAEPE
jgi:nucleotide-binding universal stress UspA family protein